MLLVLGLIFLVGWEWSQCRVWFALGSVHVSRRVSLRHHEECPWQEKRKMRAGFDQLESSP